MNEPILQVLVPTVALVSALIAGYVSLKNRALLAEVRKEIAEVENRIIAKINGTYVRAGECHLREELLAERISTLAGSVRKAEPPPDR